MTTSQGTSRGTQGAAGDTESGGGALQRVLYLGGGLAVAGAVLGLAGAVSSTPVVWAFGLGAAAVSLSVLAVGGYHGRSQSV
jgi:hypothetical protein